MSSTVIQRMFGNFPPLPLAGSACFWFDAAWVELAWPAQDAEVCSIRPRTMTVAGFMSFFSLVVIVGRYGPLWLHHVWCGFSVVTAHPEGSLFDR